MKIVIIELNFHFDSLDSLCKLFDRNGNELLVFTTRQLFNKLSDVKNSKNIQFHIQRSSRLSLINNNLELINSSDLIFINTISRDYRTFATVKFDPCVVLRVHNIHKTFDPLKHINWTFTSKRIWKMSSYFLREIVFGGFLYFRKKCLNNMDYFTFPDLNMQFYVLEKNFIAKSSLAPILPIKFFTEELNDEKNENVFSIVIIGAVDYRRKDYAVVVDSLKNLKNSSGDEIEIVFLGNSSGADGRKLKISFSKLNRNDITPKFYDNHVELPEFKRVIAKADVLLAPLRQDAIVEIYEEKYGRSKTSGSLSDMITFAKPLILAGEMDSKDSLYSFIQTYHNYLELQLIFENLIHDSSQLEVKRQDLVNHLKEKYKAEKIYTEFINFFMQKVNKIN